MTADMLTLNLPMRFIFLTCSNINSAAYDRFRLFFQYSLIIPKKKLKSNIFFDFKGKMGEDNKKAAQLSSFK
jgi:hypothetical protein